MRSRHRPLALALGLASLSAPSFGHAAPSDVDWTRAKGRVAPSVATVEVFEKDVRRAQGTGFAVARGVFVTCRHLFRGCDRADLVRADGTRIPIEGVLLCEAVDDIVLLKAATDVPAVAIGDDARLLARQPLARIGFAHGDAETFAEGAYSRRRDFKYVRGAIEATVPMAAGASGCPMFDEDGVVLGMGIARARAEVQVADGLFVPISRVRTLLAARTDKTPLRPLGTAATFRSPAEWEVQTSSEMELARKAAARGDPSATVVAMRVVVADHPESVVALYELARALSRARNDDEAVRSLRAAVALDPIDLDSWEDMADALARLQRHREAIDAWDRMIDLNPGIASAWGRRGIARLGAGDPAGAIKDLEVARDLIPDDAAPWGWLALAYVQVGRDEDADRALAKVRQLAPNDVRAIEWVEARMKAARDARPKSPK